MSDSEFPSSWSDPRYIAAIVSVLATDALYFYHSISETDIVRSSLDGVGPHV